MLRDSEPKQCSHAKTPESSEECQTRLQWGLPKDFKLGRGGGTTQDGPNPRIGRMIKIITLINILTHLQKNSL